MLPSLSNSGEKEVFNSEEFNADCRDILCVQGAGMAREMRDKSSRFLDWVLLDLTT